MCELCVDIAQLNNIPYTLPRVVSLPPEIVLSARGFQSQLTLVFTHQSTRIYSSANAYTGIGLRTYVRRPMNIASLPETFRRLWNFGAEALPTK